MSEQRKELTERKKAILRAIIDTHINLGEPVGSKYLTQYKQIAFSSATIRNEMAELEEMGYLEQLHTSSGRIPSQLGYRFYVDQLMQQYRMTQAELGELNKLLTLKAAELDRILDRATKLMSMLTNYTGVALKRAPQRQTVARFDAMYLSPRSFILVMLTASGTVKTRQVRLGFEVSRETLERLTEVLNDCVAGLDMDSITLPVMLDMQRRVPGGEQLVNPIIRTIYETVSEPDDGELMFDGVNNLLNYPEFSDIDRVRDMLGLFDQQDDLREVMSTDDGDHTNVYIGSENAVEVMNNSSLIFRTVKSGDRVIGAIGVIGPRRMDYSKVVTLVDYMSNNISRMMLPDELGAGDDTEE
ncbi:MAG: heat-inducible transcription repressor HrcA [Clostridia bacterium]|nr:heat-inducible transcription repressor HrcA [Clostridia bacterium]